jgi:hypothetical protein
MDLTLIRVLMVVMIGTSAMVIVVWVSRAPAWRLSCGVVVVLGLTLAVVPALVFTYARRDVLHEVW